MTPDPPANDALANLFRDPPADDRPTSPFGEDASGGGTPETRLRNAIVRLRHVRAQAGSDGLTPSATRTLLDELVRALEAIGDTLPDGPGRSP